MLCISETSVDCRDLRPALDFILPSLYNSKVRSKDTASVGGSFFIMPGSETSEDYVLLRLCTGKPTK